MAGRLNCKSHISVSGVEHLTLLVGKKSVALAMIRHFGSLKGLARFSFQELLAIPSTAFGRACCCRIEHVRPDGSGMT